MSVVTKRKQSTSAGFALPTVLIASVVMLIVLLSGLVAASSANTAIKKQYYGKLAREAADAGLVMAKTCLKQNNYSATTWSSPLRTNTTCTGGALTPAVTCTTPTSSVSAGGTLNQQCGVVETSSIRTTFDVSVPSGGSSEKSYVSTGRVYLLRPGSRTLLSTQSFERREAINFKDNPLASRPVKRFWLFGQNAGIDFDVSGATASLVNKCASGQTCYAGEGSTAISTKSGTLQFWTDGRTIWNRNGLPMSNGSGLIANPSTTQAAAVFPLGSDERTYVVITNTTENGSTNVGRLYYSVVDMTADGGLGAVTAKNATLGTGNYSSEALAAAPKADGSGYWVMTYTPYTLAMVVFSFDNNGTPNQTPITQPANTISPTNYAGIGGFGTLNFNADYTKLVMLAGDHCISGTCSTREGVVRLMSFNPATGQVAYMNSWQAYPEGAGYSADFSPSGNYIYSAAIYPGRLARYTINPGDSDATIKASQTLIGATQPGTATSCTGGGQILRAPDGKMYIANCGTQYLSVVNAPDASSPNFVYNQLNLDPSNTGTVRSTYGLPQMATVYSPLFIRY